MLQSLAVANYRSVRSLVMPLGPLNVVTGANGSGKSNLYRALRLLAETACGNAVAALAREGGLGSVLWAGPETISREMRAGTRPVQGGPRKDVVNLRLGFAGDALSYAVDFGLPPSGTTVFSLDPELKREVIWHGAVCRPATMTVDRRGPVVRTRSERGKWLDIATSISTVESMLTEVADPERAPEVLRLRESVRSWRFYDHFRTDAEAPARQSRIGTRTPVLGHDGADLAAAIATIEEVGDEAALHDAVDDAFPGSSLHVVGQSGLLELAFEQHGLLRPLSQAELSDGTLRYLLWIAALLTPRPPELMVLNEPETSLHPDLLPALARLIRAASEHSQIWVVTHAPRLVAALEADDRCHSIMLEKSFGETAIVDQCLLDAPPWNWPAR